MPVLFDTSVYINAFRLGDDQLSALRRWGRQTPVWLSAVVLEELYAGAGAADRRIIYKLEHDFERAGRILIPNLRDWVKTGDILSRLGRKYGYAEVGRGRLTNDSLIAASAARNGATVLTANVRDFARLGEFCSLSWQVFANLEFISPPSKCGNLDRS